MDNTKQTMTSIAWLIVKIICVLTQTATSVWLVYSIISMHILKTWIVVAIAVVLLLLLIINVVFALARSKTHLAGQIVCIVLSLLITTGCIIAVRYTGAVSGFLNKITAEKTKTKEYSVVVNIDSGLNTLEQLSGKSMGLLQTNPVTELAKKRIEELASVEADIYDDISIIDELMTNNLLDAAVLDSGRLEVMQEEMPEIFDSKKVIYVFDVEYDEDTTVSSKEITTEPFVVYISGSDSRNGLKATAHSDVNIVVVVNPRQSKILLASIPRDTYVQLHGTTGLKDKLTHAGLYSVEMSKQTIEDLLNIKIDHTIKVSFDAVVTIVDAIGGIEIYSDTAMNLPSNKGNKICSFIEGTQWVDGVCALRFARERKTYYTGDIHRGANQQEILNSIIKKLSSSKDYLLNIPEILDAASESIETSLTYDDITSFIRLQLANQINWQVESIDISGKAEMLSTYSLGDNFPRYVMIPDEESVQKMTNTINKYLEKEGNE